MNKYFIVLSSLMIFINIIFPENIMAKKNIIWKYGVAIIDGVPKYIDPNKMYLPTLFISRKTIQRSKDPILKAAIINIAVCDTGPCLIIYDTNKNRDPYLQIVDSRRKYKYKIENDTMYISKDGKLWEELFIKIIDEHPTNKDTVLIIYLQSKIFSGEYDISTH